MTPNPDFKVMPLFNAEYLRKSWTYRDVVTMKY